MLYAHYGLFAGLGFRVLWVEDDFRFHNHDPLDWGGGFEPLMLERLADLVGEPVTRDHVVAAVTAPGTPHPWRTLLQQVWRAAQLEVAEGLAHVVRERSGGSSQPRRRQERHVLLPVRPRPLRAGRPPQVDVLPRQGLRQRHPGRPSQRGGHPANPQDRNDDTTWRCNNGPTGRESTYAPDTSHYSQKNYCDLMGVWVDPDTGHWYGLVHNEFTPQPFGDGLHYDAIDYAVSKDQGRTWTIKDHVLTSPYSTKRDDNAAFPHDLYYYGYGDARLFVDTASGYFYVYYDSRAIPKGGDPTGWTDGSRGHVARAPMSAKMAPGSWKKWYDGVWSQPESAVSRATWSRSTPTTRPATPLSRTTATRPTPAPSPSSGPRAHCPPSPTC